MTIQPAGASTERVAWSNGTAYKENDRVILLLQGGGLFHAIPKRAFNDTSPLAAFRDLARGRHDSSR